MKRALLSIAIALTFLAQPARAQLFSEAGFIDLRLIHPSDQRSWENGGLGKLGYGGGADPGVRAELAEIVADLRTQPAPGWLGVVSLRYDPLQKTLVDAVEAYARYQPVETGPLHWTVKAGAFFPPISLENESIGWSSPWTLTPSAINSWVGDELRTIGVETTLEWRLDSGTLGLVGSVYGWNDPTGTLLAARGWAFDDRPTGLIGADRMPNLPGTPPNRTSPFMEIDQEPGWYAGASWREDGVGRVAALYYDNRADPTLDRNDVYGWRTRFVSLGAELDLGDVVLLSQGMAGSTEFDPNGHHSATDFQSAYLLAGWIIDDWTVAGRVDVFATEGRNSQPSRAQAEHGNALTASVSWRPEHWLKLSTELMRVDSTRSRRLSYGVPPDVAETQLQLSARLYF